MSCIFLGGILISYFLSRMKFNSQIELYNWLNYLGIFYISSFFSNKGIITNWLTIISILLSSIGINQIIKGESVASTFVNPNIYAGWLIVIIPVLFSNIVNEIRKQKKSISLLLCEIGVIMSSICLIFTESIAAISAIIVAYILIFTPKKWRFIFLFLIISLVIFIKHDDPRIFHRLNWWDASLKIWSENIVFGTGPATFHHLYPKYRTIEMASIYPHNFVFQLLSEYGLLTTLTFFSIILYLFKKVDNHSKVIIIALLLQNLLDYNIFIPSNALLFWSVIGMGYNEEKPMRIHSKIKLISVFLLLYITVSILRIYLSVKDFIVAKNISDIEKSQQLLLRSIKFNDKNWLSYERLAILEYKKFLSSQKKEHIINSIEILKKAVKENKALPRVYIRIAKMSKLLNERKNAFKYLKLAMEYDLYFSRKYLLDFLSQ